MKFSFRLLLWPLIALLIYLMTQTLCGIPMGVAMFLNPEIDLSIWTGPTLFASSIVTSIIILVLPQFGLRRSFSNLGCDRLTAVIAIIATLFTLLASDIVNEWFDLPNEFEELFVGMSGTIWGVLSIAIFGPICEEIVFRGGIMKPMLDKGVNPWIPIFISAVVFGLIHGNPAQIPFATMVGVVFGIIYYRTRSLIITSLCHILNNSFSVILMNVYGEDLDNMTFDNMLGHTGSILMVAITVVAAVLLLRIVWRRTA